MREEKIAALLLAAGASSRMRGAFKPLLPLGGEAVIERTIRLFRDAGIDDVRVVVGHRSAELTPILERHGARSIRNANHAAGMFSSICAGVASLEEEIEAFFLLPADIPLVRPATVTALREEFRRRPGPVYRPSCRGRAGHPVLLPASLRPCLLRWEGEGGLRGFLSSCVSPLIDVEVGDEGILIDFDTPEDYTALLARLRPEAETGS
ncbi:MAG: nucleotidyltransferase family protein [bacterium]